MNRTYDELRNFLRSRSRHNQYVPAARRRRRFLDHARIAIGIMIGAFKRRAAPQWREV
jgi:hypothetical protein